MTMRPSPFALPPGPERRKLMEEQGFHNIGPEDFTEAEEAANIERSKRIQAEFAELDQFHP